MELIISIVKIPFKLTGLTNDPRNIDFDIMGLSKNYIVIKGELKYVEYYKSYDPIAQEYSDLVVKITNTYNRDGLGIILYRHSIIEWYLEDDSVGITKEWVKYYPTDQTIDEGIKRRKNMIAAAKVVLLRELKVIYGEPTNQQYGFDLLLSVSTQMKYYEEGYTQPLKDAIANSNKAYLTQDIKDLIITELTF